MRPGSGLRRRAWAHPRASVLAACFAALWVGRAAARSGQQPGAEDKALATALFEEGRTLMSQGRTSEACPKLEESHRLDPSGGTILNLALCNEQLGLLARSWSEFHEAIAFAARDGRSDREEVAELHIRALEPRLSRLTVVVPGSARVEGLRIERDGRELGPPSWSIAMPVDGGEHIVRATAPGKVPFSTTIVIAMESDTRTVEVPAFAAAVTATATASGSPLLPVGAPPTSHHTPGEARRWIAGAIGAAGLVQWAAAGYFGLQAFRKHAESNSACPDGHCTEVGVALNEQSGRAADTSTVLALTGLASVAASLYVLWSARTDPEVAPRARETPKYSISSTGSTIVLLGRF